MYEIYQVCMSYVWHIPRCVTCWRYLSPRTYTKIWPPFIHHRYQIYVVYILVYVWCMSCIKGGQNFVRFWVWDVFDISHTLVYVVHMTSILGISHTYDMYTIYISLCIRVLGIAILNNNVFVHVFKVHITHMSQPTHWTSPMRVHQTRWMLLTLSFLMGMSWWKLSWQIFFLVLQLLAATMSGLSEVRHLHGACWEWCLPS